MLELGKYFVFESDEASKVLKLRPDTRTLIEQLNENVLYSRSYVFQHWNIESDGFLRFHVEGSTYYLKKLEDGITYNALLITDMIIFIGGDLMDYINTSSEKKFMKHISNMNRDNSVLQEEDKESIHADVEKRFELKQMIQDSLSEYKDGKGMTTSKILRSFSVKDFE